MTEQRNRNSQWPSPEDYGRRFDELNKKLESSLARIEFQGESPDDIALLQYRLSKIAIAAEDIRHAIAILETEGVADETMASAIVELRKACTEVDDSFTDADFVLVQLLNFVSA